MMMSCHTSRRNYQPWSQLQKDCRWVEKLLPIRSTSDKDLWSILLGKNVKKFIVLP